jgi:hypothetical protein
MVDCSSRKFIPAFLPKALINKCCIRQVFWLNPFSAFPLAQWLVLEMVPPGRNGFYSYGDSAGMEKLPDFPFNDSVWRNQP